MKHTEQRNTRNSRKNKKYLEKWVIRLSGHVLSYVKIIKFLAFFRSAQK